MLHDPSTCLSAIDVSEVFAVFLSALADSRSFRPDKGLSDKNIVSRDCGTRDLPLGGERNIFLSLRRNGPFVKNIFASVHRAISIRIVRICRCLNSRGTTTVSPKCVVKTAQTRKKQIERENVKAPGENVFLDASPPRIFWQNWQPDRKVSARTGILGLRWVKKCVGDPTQHQFCTENLESPSRTAHAPIGIRAFRTKKTSQAICRVVIRHRKPDQQKHPTCPSRDSPCVVCGNFGDSKIPLVV